MTNRLKIIVAISGLFLSPAVNFAIVPSWATKDNAILTLAIATPITVPIANELSAHIIKSLSPKGMGIYIIKAMPVIANIPLGLSGNIQLKKRLQQGNQKGSRWWYAAPGITAATLGVVQYYRNRDALDFLLVGLVSSATLMACGYAQAQKEIRLERRQQEREQAIEYERFERLGEEALRLQLVAEKQQRDNLMKQIGQEYLYQQMLRQEQQLHFDLKQLQAQTDHNNRLTQEYVPTEHLDY